MHYRRCASMSSITYLDLGYQVLIGYMSTRKGFQLTGSSDGCHATISTINEVGTSVWRALCTDTDVLYIHQSEKSAHDQKCGSLSCFPLALQKALRKQTKNAIIL